MEADFNLIGLRGSLESLRRLQQGWRPGESFLAKGQRVERWMVVCDDPAIVYQFVGFTPQPQCRSSVVIATALAIDPEARWALLFPNRWITIGEALPMAAPFDPAEVIRRAEAWLLSEIARESIDETNQSERAADSARSV